MRALLALALAVPLGSGSALAAGAADGGWFDPQSPGATQPASATPPAVPAAATTPSAPAPDERPSLAPSPLLERETDAGTANASVSSADDRDPRALSDFRPALDPYGSWLQHPTYGTVWVPSQRVVGAEFSPYVSAGHWALDDDGNWVWVSDYPFGGVVFHYGRWVWVGGTGWAWVPGYRYAPAWVHWRVPTAGYAYVGWSPMGPDFIWYNGFAVSYWYGVSTPWIYCSSSYVFRPHVHHYVVRDRVLVTRLNEHTRRYVPASRVGVRSTVQSGPPLREARVPATAVPRQRVSATVPPMTGAGRGERSAFVGRGRFSADGVRPARSSASPAEAARFREPPAPVRPREPSRFRTAPAPGTSRDSGVAPSRPRSFAPSTPRSSETRSFTPSTPRSFTPSTPRSFTPSTPRSFSPSPGRSVSPRGVRSFGGGGGGSLHRGRR